MKRLLSLFINPWFWGIGTAASAIFCGLDYAMRDCSSIEIWPCLSFVGRFFEITFFVIGGGNVLIRILKMAVDSISEPRKHI